MLVKPAFRKQGVSHENNNEYEVHFYRFADGFVGSWC